MDVFVSYDAKRSLRAESILHSGDGPDGLLLGHKRGPRFVIEEILPTLPGFFSSRDALAACERHLQNRVLGFFTFRPGNRKRNKLLAPITYGKLYMEVTGDGTRDPSLASYIVEFEEEFFLTPIPLVK